MKPLPDNDGDVEIDGGGKITNLAATKTIT